MDFTDLGIAYCEICDNYTPLVNHDYEEVCEYCLANYPEDYA